VIDRIDGQLVELLTSFEQLGPSMVLYIKPCQLFSWSGERGGCGRHHRVYTLRLTEDVYGPIWRTLPPPSCMPDKEVALDRGSVEKRLVWRAVDPKTSRLSGTRATFVFNGQLMTMK